MVGVFILVQKQTQQQLQYLAENELKTIHQKIEYRINYLIENSESLAQNELMINALTDANERDLYLPKLVQNFMSGKDVISLDVVDFDGRVIFQSNKNIPQYNQSSQLRLALAMGEFSYKIDKLSNNLVILSPLKYYDTTQGALVITFNLQEIIKRNTPSYDVIVMQIYHNNRTIFQTNKTKISYRFFSYQVDTSDTILNDLDITVKIGIDNERFLKPLYDILIPLGLLSLFFIVIGFIFAFVTAHTITQPILTLHKRIKEASKEKDSLCSPLGTQDELEDLAIAFDERTLSLQYQAEHDALTNLPNRVLFVDRLSQALKYAKRQGNKLAVLFIDLDRFKEVNDSFGHIYGDKLLQVVSDKIESNIRQSDSFARIGGDEFVMLVDNLKDENHIVEVIQKIMDIFQEPFLLEEHQFYITCSIGVAIYPYHGKNVEELMKNADTAMYKAKDDGRNTYHFYTDDMTKKAIERITLETQMRQALEENQFQVYLQPQVDMRSGDIIGMEALIRWTHPELGFITPDKFIPIAEDTGMIIDIDRWMMREAMKYFKSWNDKGFNVGILSLNLSMIQLNQKDFLDYVQVCIDESNLDVSSILFEITETQIMKNPEHSIITLNQLKEIGVQLAIDDFGTGHSSLSYIKRLPVDKIKIDQSFIRDIPDDINDIELTRTIITMSKSLNMNVLAEGVETKEQADFLVDNGCYEAQGYFYFKPQAVETIEKILEAKA
jgi:diguanylate cyclase (GGDEF)-like protein